MENTYDSEYSLGPLMHTPVSFAGVIVKDNNYFKRITIVGSSYTEEQFSKLFPTAIKVLEIVYLPDVNYKQTKEKLDFLVAILNQKGAIRLSTFRWATQDSLEAICDLDIIFE